jgi:hypothetical protein
VTTAQRARLVVALGILNLVLATLALGVGTFGVPSVPPRPDTAANSPSPSAPTGTTEPQPTPGSTDEPGATNQPGPTGQPGSTDEPTGSPGTEPPSSEPPASQLPSVAPSVPTQAPTLVPGPAVSEPPAVVPASNPPLARPPTATPTPRPNPTPPPAATPEPVSDQKPRPPCPQNVSEPPGQVKVDTRQQPCGKGKAAKIAGKSGKPIEGGFIIIIPIAGAAAWLAGAGRRDRKRSD